MKVLISDNPEAGALKTAKEFGVETVVLAPRDFARRDDHDRAIIEALEKRDIGLVCLAGYMRLISREFVARFRHRVFNIHPALLPSFPGLHGQRQAVEYGVKVSGASVIFADEGCDTGPVVIQAAVPLEEGDTEETLSARILKQEHRIYPEAVRLFCAGRLKVEGRRVLISNKTHKEIKKGK